MKKKIILTKEQTQQIESYLSNKDVDYIDLHLEVLDHISTDIENEMNQSTILFSDVFEKVKLKWNKIFSYKWTYWLGTSNGGSKLFIDNCLKIYKSLIYKSLITIFLMIGSFYWFVKNTNLELIAYKSIINNFSILFAILYAVLLVYWRFKINKTNLKSTFSYLFNKQIFPNIYMILFLLVNEGFNNQQEFKYSKLLIFLLLGAILFIGNVFFKQHIKTVSNYKKYQLK